MVSSGGPCPRERSVLFHSEDNQPKALTNGDGGSRSCRGMAASNQKLGTGCITLVWDSIFDWPRRLQPSESQRFVLTDKVKVPAFRFFAAAANQD